MPLTTAPVSTDIETLRTEVADLREKQDALLRVLEKMRAEKRGFGSRSFDSLCLGVQSGNLQQVLPPRTEDARSKRVIGERIANMDQTLGPKRARQGKATTKADFEKGAGMCDVAWSSVMPRTTALSKACVDSTEKGSRVIYKEGNPRDIRQVRSNEKEQEGFDPPPITPREVPLAESCQHRKLTCEVRGVQVNTGGARTPSTAPGEAAPSPWHVRGRSREACTRQGGHEGSPLRQGDATPVLQCDHDSKEGARGRGDLTAERGGRGAVVKVPEKGDGSEDTGSHVASNTDAGIAADSKVRKQTGFRDDSKARLCSSPLDFDRALTAVQDLAEKLFDHTGKLRDQSLEGVPLPKKTNDGCGQSGPLNLQKRGQLRVKSGRVEAKKKTGDADELCGTPREKSKPTEKASAEKIGATGVERMNPQNGSYCWHNMCGGHLGQDADKNVSREVWKGRLEGGWTLRFGRSGEGVDSNAEEKHLGSRQGDEPATCHADLLNSTASQKLGRAWQMARR